MILWLDLETYSDVDIKNGAYRYAEGAEVILFSYAIDDTPARVVDVAHGEKYPQAVVDAFNNPDCTLIAHNAQFDRTVLKKFVPMDYSPPGSVHGILQARILEWVAISFSNQVPTEGN